jgi:hypothetical protein
MAAREVLAVRREAARNRMVPNRMVPNRMVPVGGVAVAITTEQERITAAFREGTPALQTRSREEHVLRWIYRSEKYGAGGPPWVPYKPQNRAWGHRGGQLRRQRRRSGHCFVRVSRARVPRANVTRLFLGGLCKPLLFWVLNVQTSRAREVVGLVLAHQSHDVAL